MNQNTNKLEKAKKEFIKKHAHGYIGEFIADVDVLLSSQQNELEKKYENCPQCTGLREQFKEDLIKKIKGLKVVNRTAYSGETAREYSSKEAGPLNYNQALQDVLTLLQTNK